VFLGNFEDKKPWERRRAGREDRERKKKKKYISLSQKMGKRKEFPILSILL